MSPSCGGVRGCSALPLPLRAPPLSIPWPHCPSLAPACSKTPTLRGGWWWTPASRTSPTSSTSWWQNTPAPWHSKWVRMRGPVHACCSDYALLWCTAQPSSPSRTRLWGGRRCLGWAVWLPYLLFWVACANFMEMHSGGQHKRHVATAIPTCLRLYLQVLGNAKGVVAAVVSVFVFGNLVTLQVSCLVLLSPCWKSTPLLAPLNAFCSHSHACAQAQMNHCILRVRIPNSQRRLICNRERRPGLMLLCEHSHQTSRAPVPSAGRIGLCNHRFRGVPLLGVQAPVLAAAQCSAAHLEQGGCASFTREGGAAARWGSRQQQRWGVGVGGWGTGEVESLWGCWCSTSAAPSCPYRPLSWTLSCQQLWERGRPCLTHAACDKVWRHTHKGAEQRQPDHWY